MISKSDDEEIIQLANDAMDNFMGSNHCQKKIVLGAVSTNSGLIQIIAYIPNPVKAGDEVI